MMQTFLLRVNLNSSLTATSQPDPHHDRASPRPKPIACRLRHAAAPVAFLLAVCFLNGQIEAREAN